MTLLVNPAGAQDPRQVFINALKSQKPIITQLLPVYNSSPPEAKKQIDRDYTRMIQKEILEFQSLVPANTWAEWDNQMRQATGSTIVQLLQGATTLPALARAVDTLISVLSAAPTQKVPTQKPPTQKPPTQPAKPPTQPAKPPTPKSPTERKLPFTSLASDGVFIGSGKMGSLLFGVTKLSDEEAKAQYKKNVAERKAALEKAMKAADARAAAAQRKIDAFKESVASKQPVRILGELNKDLVEAKKQRWDALKGLALPLASLGLWGAGELVPATEFTYPTLARGLETLKKGAEPTLQKGKAIGGAGLQLAEFYEIAKEKFTAGEGLSREDLELGAKGLVNVATGIGGLAGRKIVAAGATVPIGVPVAGAQVLLGGTEFYLAQHRVSMLENTIEQQLPLVQENLRRLENEKLMAQEDKKAFERQIKELNQEEGYFDVWRPR